MRGDTSANFDVLTLTEAELVDQACDRFETAWRSGDWPCIEGYLDAVAEPCRLILLHELIKLELELRTKVGEVPTAEEYRLRFPDQAHAIDEIFREALEPGKARSTLADSILGSAAPNPDTPTLDAPTVDLDPGRIAELPTVDGGLGTTFWRLRDPRPAGLGRHGCCLSIISAQSQPIGRPQADQGRLVRRLDRGDHSRGGETPSNRGGSPRPARA